MALNIFDTVREAERALEAIQESQQAPEPKTHSFSNDSFTAKLQNDTLFLESVYDEYIGNEKLKDKYNKLITETVVATYELLKEADVSAKMITPTVEYSFEPLSEDETIQHYKRAFNMILEEEFNKKNVKKIVIKIFRSNH